MAKKNDSDVVFIAAAAAVGLFLIFKGKDGTGVSGVGDSTKADGILRALNEIDRMEAEISLLESTGKYTEADKLDDRLVDLMDGTRDRLVSYTGGKIDPLTAWDMIASAKMRGRIRKLLTKRS